MGTDIHVIFQARTDPDNAWADIPHNYNTNRHYSLFAWLADVRQGNSYIKPLSLPRGLPADFQVDENHDHLTPIDNIPPTDVEFYSDHYKYKGVYSMGSHSFSWLTADEILAVTPSPIAKQGIIPITGYHTWDKTSPPKRYCAEVSGPDVLVVTPDVVSYYGKQVTHVRVCWIANLEQEFKYFTDEIRRLSNLYKGVRMVFGFDS